ncbi:hypothetical protein WJ63_06505 [Burkholderia pyrrocinia]|nr:hypothetical protein WJ63_06505 [Burkholderia pyrrocinia]
MKTAISYRNISELARPDLKGLIGNLLDRHLQPHLSHFPAELVRLRATLERSGHRSLYRARLRLALPNATLACSDESPELGKALELSFAELQRQLERHIAHLRHEDNWRRKERRAGLRRLKDAAAGGTPEEELSAKETRRLATALVADMPMSWRQALVLCRMEAVPQASAAQVLGTSKQELECRLVAADAFLKARLAELRLTPRDASVAGDYIETGTPPPASRLTWEFDDAMRGHAPESGSAWR